MKILKLGNDYANAQNFKKKEVLNNAYNSNAAGSYKKTTERNENANRESNSSQANGQEKKKKKTSKETDPSTEKEM